jgi:hypothetical protein
MLHRTQQFNGIVGILAGRQEVQIAVTAMQDAALHRVGIRLIA